MTTTLIDVRTVAVTVGDQDRAVEFYLERLGFDKRSDTPIGSGLRWIEVAPPGASVSIALAARPGGVVGPSDTGIRFTTNDADAEHAAMRDRGVDVDPVLRWPGVPAMFTFRDIDSNTFYVVEQR
jgi:predicted enzyme related to lactoylglutathione lyase